MRNRISGAVCITAILLLSLAPAAAAEDDGGSRLGGHIGFAIPWVVFQDGDATAVWDFFQMGVPMGITVKDVLGPMAFDLEVVPLIDEDQNIDVLIHPGLIYPTKLGAVGMRLAFEVDGDSIGFTPLFARPLLQISKSSSLFVELDLPVRFPRGGDPAVAIATHVGISF